MEALRLILTPVERQLVIDLPEALSHGECEVIILPVSQTDRLQRQRRRPSDRLQGTRVSGDLLIPVVADEAWDALQ